MELNPSPDDSLRLQIDPRRERRIAIDNSSLGVYHVYRPAALVEHLRERISDRL
jgi:hypothetical protein